MRRVRGACVLALLGLLGCTHGVESGCAQRDGGPAADCMAAGDDCDARGACSGPGEPDPAARCREQETLFYGLFLDPEVGYALPEEMDVSLAQPGLLVLARGDTRHRIELPGVAFDAWFSLGERVSLAYRVDAPYRGLEVEGETSTLLQMAQSSAPLPNGVQLLPGQDGCTFTRAWDRDTIVTLSGLRVVAAGEETQRTAPAETRWIDGWLVGGTTQTRAASPDGTRPRRDAWAAIALGPRS